MSNRKSAVTPLELVALCLVVCLLLFGVAPEVFAQEPSDWEVEITFDPFTDEQQIVILKDSESQEPSHWPQGLVFRCVGGDLEFGVVYGNYVTFSSPNVLEIQYRIDDGRMRSGHWVNYGGKMALRHWRNNWGKRSFLKWFEDVRNATTFATRIEAADGLLVSGRWDMTGFNEAIEASGIMECADL